MSATETLSLPGEVQVTQPRGGAFALVFAGADAGGLPLEAALARSPATTDAPLPARLHGLHLQDAREGAWRIRSREGEFTVEAGSLLVHRDLSAVMGRTLAPRPAPLAKRLFWRIVLGLAASAAGRRLLTRLRSR